MPSTKKSRIKKTKKKISKKKRKPNLSPKPLIKSKLSPKPNLFPKPNLLAKSKESNLLKDYKKRTLYSLITIETFFVFLFVYLVYSFSENYYRTGILDLGQIFPIALVLLAILFLYKILEKKFSPLLEAQKQTTKLTKDAFRRNLKDFRGLTLLLVDLIFIVVIILAIWAYIDPDVSIINWTQMGIYPPFTTLGNVIVFAFIMLILYYLYKITKEIRF